MRVIIAGTRSITDYATVVKAIEESGFEVTEVLTGCARGVDLLGERYAKERGIPYRRFPADWKRDGKAANAIRNRRMAENADALIAVWDGRSSGTANAIEEAQRLGLPVHAVVVGQSNER